METKTVALKNLDIAIQEHKQAWITFLQMLMKNPPVDPYEYLTTWNQLEFTADQLRRFNEEQTCTEVFRMGREE